MPTQSGQAIVHYKLRPAFFVDPSVLGNLDQKGSSGISYLSKFLVTKPYDSYTLRILIVLEDVMGIVKIDDELHEEVRRASAVMCRSINAQAEFWMKIGMLAEANPTMAFNDIVKAQLAKVNVDLVEAAAA
jgi:hypothetical protein